MSYRTMLSAGLCVLALALCTACRVSIGNGVQQTLAQVSSRVAAQPAASADTQPGEQSEAASQPDVQTEAEPQPSAEPAWFVRPDGPMQVDPLPMAVLPSPVADGVYPADLNCAGALAQSGGGAALTFQAYDYLRYDGEQVYALMKGDTITGCYGPDYDNEAFTLTLESSPQFMDGRVVLEGLYEGEFSGGYTTSIELAQLGSGYVFCSWYGPDHRAIGQVTLPLAADVKMVVKPLGQAQELVAATGIAGVQAVLAANSNSWWMPYELSVQVEGQQVVQLRLIESDAMAGEEEAVSHFVFPAGSTPTAQYTDLAPYLGTSLADFVAAHPELRHMGTTSGDEYTDDDIIIGAGYYGKLIGYAWIENPCSYSINGITYGMPRSEAEALAAQAYGAPTEQAEDELMYSVDPALETVLHIHFENGAVTAVRLSSELNLYLE